MNARIHSPPRRTLQATAWIFGYILLIAFPLLVLLFGDLPNGAGFWWDFAMGLGFAGLAMLAVQFVLTARFRRATAPFGIDIIYYFHRWAAIGAVGLILIHYLILRIAYPDALGSADPREAAWHMTAGRTALFLFLLIMVSSLWRKQLRIEYDRWRIWHGILAASAVILAISHIHGVGYYTRAPSKQLLWTGYSAFWLLILVYIRLIKPWLLSRKPYRVTALREERGNSWTLTVEPVGFPRLNFRPGQFAWLTLGTSPFRAREHPFSFSGSAAHPSALEFTIKELGDFTSTIKHTRIGEVAYVDGPHGVFTTDLYPDAAGFFFVAGGVGIAPVMSILRTLADRNDRRPLQLIYGNSSWDRILFREELEELKNRLNLTITHVLQHPPAGWTGESGLITQAVLKKWILPASLSFVFFVCGPKGMIDTAQRSLRAMGVPGRCIHFEHFDMV